MEYSVGLWLGIFLGLLLLGCSETEADVLNLTASTGHNYFSEGASLVSNLALVSKRKVTARKEALESVYSSENVTQGAGESKEPKQTPIDLSQPIEVKVAQVNSSKAADHVLQHTSTPVINEHRLSNVSSTVLHKEPTPYVSSNASVKTAPAKEEAAISPLSVATTPLPKKKSKPGLTYDVEDLPRDENGKAIVTEENLVGAGPSFDYVVPIVIAMLAVPFVAVLGAFLYKKSRDFWDRRHYRRMDFLIDGMYND